MVDGAGSPSRAVPPVARSPGPWTWSSLPTLFADALAPVLRDAEYRPLVCMSMDMQDSPRGEADRRLIAAAPELLAAVEALLDQVHADCLREGEEAAVDSAYALVARVKGAP